MNTQSSLILYSSFAKPWAVSLDRRVSVFELRSPYCDAVQIQKQWHGNGQINRRSVPPQNIAFSMMHSANTRSIQLRYKVGK